MTEIKIKLLGDRILVRPNVRTVTENGIILPDGAGIIPTTGTVLAVGNKLQDGYELSEGNFIRFYVSSALKESANWIVFNDELVLVLRSGDIIGTLNELPEVKIVSVVKPIIQTVN